MAERAGFDAEQVARRIAHLGDDGVRGRQDDAGTLAMADLDDAGAFELLQRLADRRAPDPVGVHQLALGRQLRARRELAAPDPRQQAIEHLVREFATRDRFGVHGGGLLMRSHDGPPLRTALK